MAEIDATALLPNDRVQQAVLEGDVTQLTRGASTRYASEGDTFRVGGTTLEVTAVEERTLGDLTGEDARREGSPSLDAYKRRVEQVHPGDFQWNDSSQVVTYRFERVE